jgi:hypothetical protein
MQIPTFQDGFFEGIWLGADKLVKLFLRTADRHSFVLSLEGVQALSKRLDSAVLTRFDSR